MTPEQLTKHFASIGARAKYQPARRETDLVFDIRTDDHGEHFLIRRGLKAPRLELLQKLPKDRHLLLYATDGHRYLCGHDERHWFVADVDSPASTVQAAKRALIPQAIRQQIEGIHPEIIDRRRNVVFHRQGEWFFIPVHLEINPVLIMKNEPIQRDRRSKPHFCQELYRVGGQLVYFVRNGMTTTTLTDEEVEQKKAADPGFHRKIIRTMVRNPEMYARGTVRHPDHATILLREWHRILLNAERVNDTIQWFD